MNTDIIEKILSDPQFLKELEQAIDSGKSEDWVYNGEEEECIDVFETEMAKESIIELLNKYFVKKTNTTNNGTIININS